jgi:predicted Zn-dependent protease with MMP-like domain
MGIYDPVGGVKRIVIFRDANPTRAEIRKTVLHEVGHLFGLDEERLRELGYG